MSDDTTIVSAKVALEVGQLTKDGVYIGRFKGEDGMERDWFADTDDATGSKGKRLLLSFNDAVKYAESSNALGHNDWILPSGRTYSDGEPDILGAIFKNKSAGAFKGKFNEDGLLIASFYRSSSPAAHNFTCAKILRFSNGTWYDGGKELKLPIRLVRSLPVT